MLRLENFALLSVVYVGRINCPKKINYSIRLFTKLLMVIIISTYLISVKLHQFLLTDA